MDHEGNTENNGYQNDGKEQTLVSFATTRMIEEDTYPLSDSESPTDVTSLIDTNIIQGELNHMFDLLIFLCLFHIIHANVETLHFESACLKESNLVQLRLRCSLYEHIEIIRVIYGYSKQRPTNQCQFSIYDCIQEGASQNILSCNGKQTCMINLTKNEIFSTTVTTKGVPTCSDFNYVQVNFGCVLDAKDICDSWKDEGAIIHVSHTRSLEKQYNECQCKVRSSLSNGQVLLHAREINRQSEDLKAKKLSNTDCKTTTYLEIATDRSERKCMDNLPSNGNALFGSGSHNFTLNYVRNDPLSELYFYLELTASPMKNDHNVQIICNWARRTTTVRTTLAMARKRKSSTINMSNGRKLSRIDLIRHPSTSSDSLEPDEDTSMSSILIDEIESTTILTEDENEDNQDEKQSNKNNKRKPLKTMKRRKPKFSSTISIDTIATDTMSIADDDLLSSLLSSGSFESLSSSEQFFPFHNETFISSVQASISPVEKKSSQIKISKNKFIIMALVLMSTSTFVFCIYCLKVTRCGCIQRFKVNLNIALLFCCEAGKLLFSSSNNTDTNSNTPTSTVDDHRRSSSLPADDYRSADYYMNETAHRFRTMESIYDYDGGGGGGGEKSVYNIDNYTEDEYDNQPPRSTYTTQYDRYSAVDTC